MHSLIISDIKKCDKRMGASDMRSCVTSHILGPTIFSSINRACVFILNYLKICLLIYLFLQK